MGQTRPFTVAQRSGRWALALSALWLALVGISMGGFYFLAADDIEALARAEALGAFQKDLSYRRWVARMGGVYVKVSDTTPPNPYLAHLKDRDVTTTGGTELTLFNPAYMTRQVHELSTDEYGLRGHITSLRPLRPENAPFDWERVALQSFEAGAEEFGAVASTGDGDSFRFMRPLRVEEPCLKCHEQQGYKVGDVRGGISVELDLAPYLTLHRGHLLTVGVGHGVFGLLGLLAIAIGARIMGRGRRRELRYVDRIRTARDEARRYLNVAQVIILVLDEDGRIVQINRYGAELLAYKNSSDLLGKLWFEVYVPLESRSQAVDAFRDVLAGGASSSAYYESEVVGDDDARHLIAWYNAPLLGEDGRTIGVLASGQDITERRRLEETLDHDRRLETIGTLAGGVAHEMNNILAVVLGLAEVIERSPTTDDAARGDARSVAAAARRGRRLVRDLLGFARRGEGRTSSVDISARAQNVVSILKRTLPERVEADLDLADTPLLARCDADRLTDVIMNLCLNAVDAMPEGGQLRVATSLRYLDDTEAEDHANCGSGHYVELCVADTGVGMSPEQCRRAFEPFFTTKPVGAGTGLGLSMAYGLVKSWGGDITIESEPARGTAIAVLLPLDEEAMSDDLGVRVKAV